ncbi:MAG TPA: MBL fold metallo-hydrolase [Rhabdochlamydiaceae bacterium]|jgi:7,8-dihydropterin-6-yl-methyl-4-(beta-D-ribofuranosyl)aminobenzene 5'-phosphate synthase|nr:MBL fold metallo-hydrolase [Rhabdochlamydiaceae bacterium]
MNQIMIKIIYDNCKANEGLQEGWGFSCLIDLGVRKILFDTGADSQAFFSNLQQLNVSCDEITDVVYSHKHSDHIAGLEEVVGKLKKDSRLFLPKKFPSKKIPSTIRTEVVEDFKEIDSGVHSLVLKGGFFLYEQALVIETSKGLVVITGCAHPGIIRILQEAQKRRQHPIHLVLGGFHLFRKKQSKINEIVDQFKALNVQIAAPCHCSGSLAIERFHQAFPDSFHKIGTGTVLTFSR